MLGLDLLLGSVGRGDMVGAEGGIERSTWVGVEYEWGKFGEPSTILKSRDSSIGIIYDIFREYVQSVAVRPYEDGEWREFEDVRSSILMARGQEFKSGTVRD